jgi:hypothetical protein
VNRFDEMKLRTQARDLMLLCHVIRRSPLTFPEWLADYGIDENILYAWGELGGITGFTIAEDERFGSDAMRRKAGRRWHKGRLMKIAAAQFSRHLSPAGESEKQCRKRRRAFRHHQKKLMQQAANPPLPNASLAERRVHTLLAVLPAEAAKAILISKAARKVRRRDGFSKLTPATVQRYVWEIARTRPKLIGSRFAEGGPTLLIWKNRVFIE